MTQYAELDAKLLYIKGETETTKNIMSAIRTEAQEKMDELESIKQDAEDVEGELQDYLNNLEGLQATLERADGIRDEAEGQHITI